MPDDDGLREASLLAPDAVVGGRFRIRSIIGKGGMGEVYAARHVTTGREVALKIIRGQAGKGDEQTRRFLREARAATAMRHPNVIEVLDVFEDENGMAVMVMELLKGEPLDDLRKRVGAMTLHEVALVMVPVALAVHAGHEKGIVHRDLKPDNIFLADGADGRTPKVLDFGIAKVLDPAKLGSETQGAETSTGSILGTPHYMSFEQAMSEKTVDHRTDIWAIGVILFEALCGRRPLEFENLGQMYVTFLQGTIPRIRDWVPDLPAEAAEAIDRCLVKEAAGRLDSLLPLISALRPYLDPKAPGGQAGGVVVTVRPVAAAPSSMAPASRGRRGRTIAIAAFVALGLVGAALSLAPGRTRAAAEPTASGATNLATSATTSAPPPVSAEDPPLVPRSAVTPSTSAPTRAIAPPRPSVARPAPSGGASHSPASASSSSSSSPPPARGRGIVEAVPY